MNDLVTVESSNTTNELSTIDSLHQLNNFKNHQEDISKELLELDDFYGKIKTILLKDLEDPDEAKPLRLGAKPPPKKSAMLIASQTSNLIAIKNLKLQFMKERTRIGEAELERRLKILIASSKEKKEDSESGEFSGQNILNYLITTLGVTLPITGDSIRTNNILDAEFSEAELDRRLEEEGFGNPIVENTLDPIIENDSNIEDEYNIDGENYKIILDEESLVFHLIDSEYNLIKELIDGVDIDSEIIDEENNVIIDKKSGTLVELI